MLHAALDIRHAGIDGLLFILDDYSPTAVEEHDDVVTVFFSTGTERDRARQAVMRELPLAAVTSRDVDDEDWARRSQQGLEPVVVGRVTIRPHPEPLTHDPGRVGITVTIVPSMGFGTGHHASTRLCLAALQTLNLEGADVLDVGTGSGILAIAARLLGARQVVGLDSDADAVQSARDNLALNPGAGDVRFNLGDLRTSELPGVDVVTANLTGALLARVAPTLIGAVHAGGTLIVGGLTASERAHVVAAFAPAKLVWEAEEDDWVGLAFRAPGAGGGSRDTLPGFNRAQ